MELFRASYYNLLVQNGSTTLLFNGVTSSLLALDRATATAVMPLLANERSRTAGVGYNDWRPPTICAADLPGSFADRLPELIEAGVFVPASIDERDALRSSYARSRARAPLFVTITTTLDCNMRCYYCYQKDGNLEQMSFDTCDNIIEWTKEQLKAAGHPKLYVDWYGGEPMLNKAVIERYTAAITAHCDRLGVEYKASMLCNGTAWPDDARGFVARNRLRSIQFSLDGPERHHNKRRGLIDPNGRPGRTASFGEVVGLIGRLIGSTKIYLRVNVDPYIGRDALELIDICASRGWLDNKTRFYPYLAVINAMTDHCGFLGKSPKFKAFESEFDDIQAEFYTALRRYRDEKSLEVVQYFPTRVTINCAAVSDNAIVFGPNGLAYKCGLDVGDHHRAHGALGSNGAVDGSIQADALPVDRWQKYDPFSHPRCGECQYLPVCMGGCPKAQIDKDAAQIQMQSAFWENNFDRIIREYYAAAGHA
ncbi:SPASM domain-containing protein [Sinorhizobium meliloti]|uniref:radical SAM/SPASM domain-containing protein n=1 Tax=Rhizobium meliloti TaxID=382 RepID=UPI000FD8D099|nr:radical SAM protein [Sinorhizobium meliloti]RVL70415.1 SPASM domain-containing protein [Sinorhizobium meliloti]